MVRFWDTSSLVPLVIEEPASRRVRERYSRGADVYVWWATPVEFASAIARRERDGELTQEETDSAFSRLDTLAKDWLPVEPRDEFLEIARRYLRTHPLRAADALQLAAAFVTSEQRPPTLEFVTLDDRLRLAAEKEGFQVVEV